MKQPTGTVHVFIVSLVLILTGSMSVLAGPGALQRPPAESGGTTNDAEQKAANEAAAKAAGAHQADTPKKGKDQVDSASGAVTAEAVATTCFGLAATIPDHSGEIFGTTGDDVIIGNDRRNIVYGGGGTDHICTGGGNDEIDTLGIRDYPGDLYANLGASDDGLYLCTNRYCEILGGNGSDWIFTDDGDDNVSGGSGADHLEGGAGADTILGGRDNDYLDGEAGFDTLAGGKGRDRCILGPDSGTATRCERDV